MKIAVIEQTQRSIAMGCLGAHRVLAGIQRAWFTGLWAVVAALVALNLALGQDLPDSATPSSAIWTGDSKITWGGYKGIPLVFVNVVLDIGFWHSRFVAVCESGVIYLSGTLPPYLSQISQSGNTTSVSMEGIPLESYVLQSAAALSGPWQSVSTNSTTADGVVNFTDPTPSNGGSRFYRVTSP